MKPKSVIIRGGILLSKALRVTAGAIVKVNEKLLAYLKKEVENL